MRFSTIAVTFYSAFALATPSNFAERNAAAAAIAEPQPIAAPAAAPLHPDIAALVTRSLEERQGLLDVGAALRDFGPALQAIQKLLNSQTLNQIISIINNASNLLDEQGSTAAKSVLIQAARLLTEENTNQLVAVFNALGPILDQILPLLGSISQLLGALGPLLGQKV